MEGSDDVFSYLEEEYVDEDDPDAMDDLPADASTARSSEEQQKWSTTTIIHPFTSAVSPTQDISSSPLEVFEQFFSPDLMERIVKENNAYAKAAMGDDKFDKWSKITVQA